MRARKRLSKRMLALLLSAVMIAEPASSSLIVHATEAETDLSALEETQTETESANDQEEAVNSGDVEGETEGGISDDQDKEDNNSDNQKPEENSGDQSDDLNKEDGDNGSDQEGTENQDPEEQEPDEQNPEDEEDESAQDLGEEEGVSEEEEQTDEDGSLRIMSMPSDYKLTSEQKQMKSALSASMGNFDDSAEGVQYVEKQVFTFADSREEAEAIAEGYHAELIEYDEGIAILKLHEISVGDALRVAAASDNNLPAVYPDYYRYIHVEEGQQNDSLLEVTEEEYELENDTFEVTISEEPTLESYEQAVEALGEPNMAYNSQYYQWQHVNVGSVYAWDAGYEGAGVTVAVLDTGVSGNTDVVPVANINKSSEAGTDASDGQGHGTHVAGIIAARLNGVGGAGIAPAANIVNIKVLNNNGSGSDSHILQGIKAAIDQNVDIINMSLGGLGYNPAAQLVIDQAYEKGIAVFVSAGNDGGTNMCYPAAYNHVICIGATDNNNQRASFSNYGAWVDLSAPGVGIWSTGNDGGFEYMSGTSQACPVAVGEAAVILSSSIIEEEKGPGRVNALENLMKKNTVSAGSGMGKGITSLTKVFKLSNAATKPVAPEFAEPVVAEDGQSVSFTIKAQTGATIYYTDNGKAPAFKNGIAAAGTKVAETNPVTLNYTSAEALTKITISAIAVNESGVASAVKKVTAELKPWVTDIEISGVSKIGKGKSTQLTAIVAPSYAKNKNLTWEIKGNPDGITVNNKGKVTTVKNTVEPGTYTIIVTANDRKDQEGQVSKEFKVEVIDSEYIQSVKFNKAKDTISIGADPKTYDLTADDNIISVKKPEYTGEITAADFVWSSSNTALATVNNLGEVTAKAPGSVKITATANDGSNKKATFTLTIKQLATSVTISGDNQVAAGASITLKAAVGPEKVSNKSVDWESDNSNVTVKNGVVKAAANTAGSCTITATAKDGSKVYGTKTISIKNGKITGITFDRRSMTLFRPANNAAHSGEIEATITGSGDCAWNAYSCTSSNPGIATAEVTNASENGKVKITVKASGKATGKTTITLMSTDGTKKKATCNVTVSNPVSKISITPSAGNSGYVARGKSLQLKAALESEYGSVSNKKVTWELYKAFSNENGQVVVDEQVTSKNAGSVKVSISSSGKVTAKKANDTYTGLMVVRAIAADNGGAEASYVIRVTDPVKEVSVWDWYQDKETGQVILIEKLTSKYIYLVDQIIQTNDQDVNEQLGLGGAHEFPVLCDPFIYNGQIYGPMPYGGVTVSSSNPQVMSASVSPDGWLLLSADKTGTATITIKAMDGGGAQVKLKFKVVP